jgi:hypothetical protein
MNTEYFFANHRLALALAAGLAASAISAQAQVINASGTISGASLGNGSYNYTLTLNNLATSTASIESLWYAWVPGQFYLPSSPSSVQVPAGWTDGIVSSFDGSSIQFINSTTPLAPGHSVTFGFITVDAPADVFGDASYYPNTPVGTSVANSGLPLSGVSRQFVVTPVPEPSPLALLAAGSIGLIVIAWRKKTAQFIQVPALAAANRSHPPPVVPEFSTADRKPQSAWRGLGVFARRERRFISPVRNG